MAAAGCNRATDRRSGGSAAGWLQRFEASIVSVMRVGVLGTLEVTSSHGTPLHVQGAKERLLLGILAAEANRTVSVDWLIELLWDGAAPVTAVKTLQGHIERLRTALEPSRPHGSSGRYVVRRGPGYALAVERDEVDAVQFSDLVARGRARPVSGEAEKARDEIAAALGLWAGRAGAGGRGGPRRARTTRRPAPTLEGPRSHVATATIGSPDAGRIPRGWRGGRGPVRRQARRDELGLDGPDGDARTRALQALIDARLVSTSDDRFEVAHEALFSAWPRLVAWLDDDAVGRAIRAHLVPAAVEWDDHGRPDDELYRGSRLAAAQEWRSASQPDLTSVEREFIGAH